MFAIIVNKKKTVLNSKRYTTDYTVSSVLCRYLASFSVRSAICMLYMVRSTSSNESFSSLTFFFLWPFLDFFFFGELGILRFSFERNLGDTGYCSYSCNGMLMLKSIRAPVHRYLHVILIKLISVSAAEKWQWIKYLF